MSGAQVGLVADRARAIVSAEASLVDPVPAVHPPGWAANRKFEPSIAEKKGGA